MRSVLQEIVDPNFPDLTELGSKISLIFVNDNEFVNFAGPTLHKVINIGGAGIKQSKKLDEKFEEEMQKGKNGVILVSFGTAYDTSLMEIKQKQSIISTFRDFPDYHFLFKISENDNETIKLVAGMDNIKLTKWTPQPEILAHSRIRGFVTHGGANSVLEAAMNGVPMVVVPLFFDQFRNAKMVEYRGIGISVEVENLSRDKLKKGLGEILYNER